MTIAQQEIFGPVLAILPYDTVEEAIAIANDTVYGSARTCRAPTRRRPVRWPRVSAQGKYI